MKEGLANKPALGNKGMLFDFKKEQKVTMNMKDNERRYDFYQHEQAGSSQRSLKPGNFETQ
jgi:uncharacterized membrane protein (UPF0127 family)